MISYVLGECNIFRCSPYLHKILYIFLSLIIYANTEELDNCVKVCLYIEHLLCCLPFYTYVSQSALTIHVMSVST